MRFYCKRYFFNTIITTGYSWCYFSIRRVTRDQWKQTIPEKIKVSKEVSIERIANKYELTGANVVNIVQQICLEHLIAGNAELKEKNFVDAIRKEFGNKGKML